MNESRVAFQVINAQPTVTGKPDLTVNFRVVRIAGEREIQVATLSPQQYDEATMPREFNLRLGHPIFVAVSAPLTTLARGDYRLEDLGHGSGRRHLRDDRGGLQRDWHAALVAR